LARYKQNHNSDQDSIPLRQKGNGKLLPEEGLQETPWFRTSPDSIHRLPIDGIRLTDSFDLYVFLDEDAFAGTASDGTTDGRRISPHNLIEGPVQCQQRTTSSKTRCSVVPVKALDDSLGGRCRDNQACLESPVPDGLGIDLGGNCPEQVPIIEMLRMDERSSIRTKYKRVKRAERPSGGQANEGQSRHSAVFYEKQSVRLLQITKAIL
jgi:hypothetical protein